MSTNRRWLLVLASIPLVPIVTVLLYAAAARVQLGFWPVYGRPDPKDLGWPFAVLVMAAVLVLGGMLLTPVAFVTSLIWSIVGFYKGSARWHQRLWPVVTVVAFLVWSWFDPGGLFDWFFD